MQVRKKLVLLGLLLISVGLIGSLITFNSIIKIEEIVEQTIIDETFSNIHIETDQMNIVLLPSEESFSKVQYVGKVSDKSAFTISSNVENDTLFINVQKEWQKLYDYFPDMLTATIYLNENNYDNIFVHTNNGKITFDGINSQKVDIKTDSGKIVLHRVQADTITTKSSYGVTEFREIVLNNLLVTSNSGKIKLYDVEGTIEGKNNHGEILLETAHLEKTMKLETDHGPIKIITKNKPTNATINASTEFGTISLFGKAVNNAEFGSGQQAIQLLTNHGNITVVEK